METIPTVLMVTDDYLPRIGGVAAHVFELSGALMELGAKVAVLATLGSDWPASNLTQWRPRESLEGGIRVVRMPALFSRKRFWSALQYKLRLPGIVDRLVGEGVVHWHTRGAIGLALADFHRRPKVFTNHSSGFLNRLKAGKVRQLQREVAHADFYIAPSRELVDGTRALGMPPDRVHYIPNGVDCHRFAPGNRSKARREWNLPQECCVVLCARRFTEKNGIHYLLEALRQIPEKPLFLFAGDHAREQPSVYETRLYQQLSGDPRVRMLGPVDRGRMPSLYRAADISVLPSLVEATSLTALESMACGCTVLATTAGGLPELIEDGRHGVLVAPAETDALAAALAGLLRDPARRRSLAEAALKRVREQFNWREVARRTLEIYRLALSGADAP